MTLISDKMLSKRIQRLGYSEAMKDVFELMADEIRALRVVMMQNPPGSDEFINAHNTVLVYAALANKLKEKLGHATKQEH